MFSYLLIVAEGEYKDVKRISIDLPIELIDGVDRLRKEWGLRRRGAVLERLLEEIFDDQASFTQDDEANASNESVYPPENSQIDELINNYIV